MRGCGAAAALKMTQWWQNHARATAAVITMRASDHALPSRSCCYGFRLPSMHKVAHEDGAEACVLLLENGLACTRQTWPS